MAGLSDGRKVVLVVESGYRESTDFPPLGSIHR